MNVLVADIKVVQKGPARAGNPGWDEEGSLVSPLDADEHDSHVAGNANDPTDYQFSLIDARRAVAILPRSSGVAGALDG